MNISTSTQCRSSSYTEIQHLNLTQKQVLTCIIAIIMVLALISNTAAIYAIVTLKMQKKSHSMKLILFLFTLDMGVCLIAMPLHLTTLVAEHTCEIVSVVEFFAQTFGHLSAYTTGVIGYDRFFRMTYLNNYSRVIKPWMIYTVVSITTSLSVAHGAAYAICVMHEWYKIGSTIGSVIDCFVFIFMIVPYGLLLRVIRKYRRATSNQHMLDSVDHSINKIALRIIVAVVFLYTPYVIITVVRQYPEMDRKMQEHQLICVVLVMCYHLIYANSFVNSVIFLSVNSACKRQLMNIFKKSTRSNDKAKVERGMKIELGDVRK